MKNNLLKALPHVVAVLLFVVLASAYFGPLWSGYDLSQGDIDHWRGMSKEISDYRLENDKEPLWTNSMFGGMPAYQISTLHPSNLLNYVDSMLRLGLPSAAGTLFLCMLGFYIFCLCIRVNPWIGMAGAIGFGFASINILYLGAGHTGKVHAIAYMAPTLGGLLLAYRGQRLVGALVFMLFLALNIMANHLQMTYYLAFLLASVALAETIRMIVRGEIKSWLLTSVMLGVGAMVAVLPGLGNLMSTYNYGKYTTRGESELTIEPDGKAKPESEKKGLETSYILEYNFARGEAWSLVIPNAKGGSTGAIADDKALLQKVPRDIRENVGKSNIYWGGQRFTGGAFYFGAVIMFLFALGLIFTRDVLRWPFLLLSILALGLCLKEETALNQFFISNIPLYNKFRDSKMILVLIQVMAPAMAVLFIDQLLKGELWIKQRKWFFAGVGGTLLLLIIVATFRPSTGPLFSSEELTHFGEMEDQISSSPEQLNMLEDYKTAISGVRETVYSHDANRSLIFAILGIVVVVLSYFKIIPKIATGLLLIALVAGDMMTVDLRYINSDKMKGGYAHYVSLDQKIIPYGPQPADEDILQREKVNIPDYDKKKDELLKLMRDSKEYKGVKKKDMLDAAASFGALNLNSNFRVLQIGGDPFTDARTSYFHKSLGGYHGAKLKSYQEVADFHIKPEMKELIDSLQSKQDLSVLKKLNVLNMLNTKYFVYNPSAPPIINPFALGNAWFVDTIQMVKSADEEITTLSTFNPRSTAIVDAKFESHVKLNLSPDSTRKIELKEYGTSFLRYTSITDADAAAIFSEIYYPIGWLCRIDGQEVPYFRANYILRGVMVPKGEHTIEWSFEPEEYAKGEMYSLAGSLLLFALIGAGGFIEFRNQKKRETEIRA